MCIGQKSGIEHAIYGLRRRFPEDRTEGILLIALDKCPGLRPIGIGEVLRRIIGKSIVKCVKRDLQLLGGNAQMCIGQKSGIEHAIHGLRRRFPEDRTEGFLLIDARNAFNSLKRSGSEKHQKALSLNLYSNQKLV